jgi:predicted nucleic acid-binding protein
MRTKSSEVLIVDASVAIKWVVTEPHGDLACALLDEDLAAPELWLVEVANALWARQARGLMTPAEARSGLGELLVAPIRSLPMAGLVSLALELAAALRHPAYDCCYLAAAQVYGCTFVTADARFVRRAARLPECARSTRLLWQ